MIEIMFQDLMPALGNIAHREFIFEAGASIFHLGDPVELVHFVQSGMIHLIRHQRDGGFLVLQRAGPGSILAEASLFSDHYHCDARAMAATQTFAVSQPDLRARISTNGEFAALWAARLSRDVQQARMQAEILTMKTVAARLDAWLASNGALPPKGGRTALAAEIGVSPEALYREIAKRGAGQPG